MPDRIYVTYSQVVSGGTPFFHATINYERTNSQGSVIVHKTIEAAPENQNLTTQQKIDATLEEMFRTDNGPSKFGHIVATENQATPTLPTTPYEVVAVGDDLSSNWSAIGQYVSTFNSAGYAYRGVNQNSNTFTSAALAAGSLPAAHGAAIDPFTGAVVVHPVPGLNQPLKEAIGYGGSYEPVEGLNYSSTTEPDGSVIYAATGGSGAGGTPVSASLQINPENLIDLVTAQYSSGNVTNTSYDVLDQHPWTTNTTSYDASNAIITGDLFQYNTTDIWSASHYLPSDIKQFNEAAAQVFVADLARIAFHGTAIDEAVPTALSYEPIFGSGYDFGIGSFDIDIGAAATVGFVDYGLGWDASAYQYWDGWTGQSNTFPTYTFDDWSYGTWIEPVVLDLDGNGVNITSRIDSAVYFDIDGNDNGAKEQTAWAGAGDGLLVIDLAANGAAGADGNINQAKEIAFAQWTADPNDTDLEALAAVFDTNLNGQLDAGDARWGEFRVWQDSDQDGVVDASELKTLTQLNITSVSLTSDHQAFMLADGSRMNGFATFTMNGVSKTLADAALAFDEVGFKRVETPNGFDYVAEDGTVKHYFDSAKFGFQQTIFVDDNFIAPDGNPMDGAILGPGNDTFVGVLPPDSPPRTHSLTVYGAGGDDFLQGGTGNDVLAGGPGKDTMIGGPGDDIIFFDSDDFEVGVGRLIDGKEGYDTAILTSTGGMTINLIEDHMEAFVGNAGNDIASAAGVTVGSFIDGRGGSDQITGSAQGDVLVGGTGNDTVNAGAGGDLVMGDAGTDTLNGEDGDDVIFAGDGNDVVHGGVGNDTLDGGVGIDTANGGAGWDKAVFGVASTNATIVHNANGTTTVTYTGGSETLTNVEVLQFTNTSVAARTTTPNDFLADTTSDVLFWNDSTGDIGFYAINNNGVYAGWNSIGGASTAYSPVGTGDFNGDGTSDVLLRNNTTGDTGFYQISNGTLQGWHAIGGSSTAYAVVGVGDFNGDGTSDILFRNNATGDTGFYQISNGTLQGWHSIGGSSTAYSVVGVGDFNGDSVSDVLFRNNATGDTGFYQLNSNGTFQGWHSIGGSSIAYSVAGVGDFNRDGVSDVLFRNNGTGDTGFYQMNSSGTLQGWHDIGGSSTAYNVVGTGDYNSDGVSDVLFRNNTTGDTGFYQLNDDGTLQGWHGIGTSSTDYHVVA
jgi:RTX calcium-binding nonapeptide repeat (4 copies)/FG-GAP-like repeat